MTRLGTLAASPIVDALSRQFDEVFGALDDPATAEQIAKAHAEARKPPSQRHPAPIPHPQDHPRAIPYTPKHEHRTNSAAHITSVRQTTRIKR